MIKLRGMDERVSPKRLFSFTGYRKEDKIEREVLMPIEEKYEAYGGGGP